MGCVRSIDLYQNITVCFGCRNIPVVATMHTKWNQKIYQKIWGHKEQPYKVSL